jgi:PAS domain S-box-containing protein
MAFMDSPPTLTSAEQALTQELNLVRSALAAAEERTHVLQYILDNIPSMIGYWDHNLVNRYSNDAYLSYFGKPKKEIEGRHIREIIGEDLYLKNLPLLKAALKGEAQNFERLIPMPSGEVKETQAHYLPDIRNGRVQGIFVLVFDVTPLKKASREKEKLYEQISESHKIVALGEMAGGVAHEINTPLGVISINAGMAEETLKNNKPDLEKLKKYLANINKTTARISKIVTGLLLFSKDRKNEAFKATRLQTIWEDTLPFCSEKFKNHGIQFICPEPAYELEIECRPIQISQVLINLLNNSYDAIENLDHKWISLEAQARGGRVEIIVTDSGPGIPREVAEKIMQPFFTTKEVGKGTGLGLSISKGIIESHGGTLELDNSASQTRFVITLPLKQS